MSANSVDIAAVEPPSVPCCVGTLDGQTRHFLFGVVLNMLRSNPAIAIDVEKLRLADIDAAGALAHVHRMVRTLGQRVVGAVSEPTNSARCRHSDLKRGTGVGRFAHHMQASLTMADSPRPRRKN